MNKRYNSILDNFDSDLHKDIYACMIFYSQKNVTVTFEKSIIDSEYSDRLELHVLGNYRQCWYSRGKVTEEVEKEIQKCDELIREAIGFLEYFTQFNATKKQATEWLKKAERIKRR